jgi:hypothetical protein
LDGHKLAAQKTADLKRYAEKLTMDKLNKKRKACSPELAKEHLEAFSKAFIDKKYLERWRFLIVERPTRAKRELRKFDWHLNDDRCRLIEAYEADPEILSQQFGSKLGVYFDGTRPPSLMTVAEAAGFQEDAIFSLEPGRLAIFFFHEGWAWICENK